MVHAPFPKIEQVMKKTVKTEHVATRARAH
jgi:hypothetical protein